ncbi:hypothetical protein V8B55DRAFT_1453237 [Mucor lusitanicus]
MEFTDYLRILGWVLVAAFPVVVVYLTGGPDQEPLLDDVEYERRKRKRQLAEKKEAEEKKKAQLEASKESPKKSNKKKAGKKAKSTSTEVVQQDSKTKAVEQPQQQRPKKKKNAKSNEKEEQQRDIVPAVITKEEERKKKADAIVAEETKPLLASEEKVEDPVDQEKVKEIDEHMDPTANYARVMRIKPEEEEEEWEAVPAEDGWSQVKSRRPHTSSASPKISIDRNAAINADQVDRYIPGLDKKQRENLARQQKKKQQKAAADALQAERLRKHQKELEKIKIQEFYSSGKGKNTPWGKNGQQQRSSKIPSSTAGINEHGQLIWD